MGSANYGFGYGVDYGHGYTLRPKKIAHEFGFDSSVL